MHVYHIWNHCRTLTPLLSCAVLPDCLEDHKTPPSTRTDYRSRLDWGVTTSLPATFFEGLLIRRPSCLYSGYFIPLCLCDLSIRCTRIYSLCAFAITPVLFLFILGQRTGSLLGFISLPLSDFSILIFSHPSYSWFSCSILSHTAFLLGAYSVCVHRDSVFCVCTLCFFSPHKFGRL